jgi:hypothetical protein
MPQIQSNYQSMVPSCKSQITQSNSQAVQVAKTQVARLSTSQNVELNLTTDEGDTVSISLAASTQADYLKYLETGQDQDGQYANQLQMSSSNSEQGFTVTVNGDLNEQERKDIGKVLKIVDQMMTNFVQGHLEPMMAKAGKLSQLDSISDLSLEMSYSRQVLVAQQTKVQPASDSLGTTYDSQGQLTATQPTIASQQPDSTQLQNQVTAKADDLSTAMAKQLAPMREFVDRMQGAVKQIFDKYRQRVEKFNSDNAFGSALIDRMHKDLLAKIQNQPIDQNQAVEAAAAA